MAKHSKEQPVTIYNRLGYEDRYEYFTTLADAFGLEVMKVILAAEKLGPKEDFNELLCWVREESDKCCSTRKQ